MSLPDVDTVRHRIEQVSNVEMRTCLMTCYLYAGRISEVVAHSSPADGSLARGPVGADARLDTYSRNDGEQEPCALFRVRTAKQYKRTKPMYKEGKIRTVALPLDPDYEPWTQTVYDYFQKRRHGPVFPFTRQKAYMYVKSHGVFEGLEYPIDAYDVYDVEKEKRPDDYKPQNVPEHMKPYAIHAIRHSRATELVDYYGFDGFNLATYGGWTLQTQARTTKAMNRYLNFNWRSYFPKLLKPR